MQSAAMSQRLLSFRSAALCHSAALVCHSAAKPLSFRSACLSFRSEAQESAFLPRQMRISPLRCEMTKSALRDDKKVRCGQWNFTHRF
jgi:hypothetical protein